MVVLQATSLMAQPPGGAPATQSSLQLTNNGMSSVAVGLLKSDFTTLALTTFSSASFGLPATQLPDSGLHTIYVEPSQAGSLTLALPTSNKPPSRPAGSRLNSSSSLSKSLNGLFVMNEGSGASDAKSCG
jgi:hypothetical protein